MAARARGLLLRARALDALGRDRDARSARLEALAELDARIARRASPALRVDRGEALLGLGRAPEALAEANTALARLPDFEPARSLADRARRVLGGAR
jgi:tetratricopeptide (TPR) repeat protein